MSEQPGEPAVDAALAELAAAENRPLVERAGAYDAVYRSLAEALAATRDEE